MFADEVGSSWVRFFDVYTLILGFYCGWCLAVSAASSCWAISTPVILISSILAISTIFLGRLRYREKSLQDGREFLWKIMEAILVVLSAFAIAIFLAILCKRLSSQYSQCEILLTGTAIFLIPLTLIWNTAQLLLALGIIYSRAVFMKPPPCPFQGEDATKIDWIRTTLGTAIPTIFYPCTGAKCTLIYSHGNAVDLGILLSQGKLRGLRDELRVNICAYDYPGYGLSTGPTNQETVCDALESYYKHIINRYRVPPSSILLYGRSMGSAPTIHLAAKLAEMKGSLGGVILESGLLSILRTVGLFKDKTRWFDMFPNVDKIGKIQVPVYITHGRLDTVVPFWHAEELYRLVNSPKEQHWIDGLGHNDMPDVWQYRDGPRDKKELEAAYKARCEETKSQNLINKEHKKRLKAFIQRIIEQNFQKPLTMHTIIKINDTVESSSKPSSPELKVESPNEDRSGAVGASSTDGVSPTSGDGYKNRGTGDLESSASKAESDSSDEGEG